MAHPNAEVAERFLKALFSGDAGGLEAALAEDVVMHVPGNNRLTGTYRGRDEVLGAFDRADQLVGGTLEREIHDITAGDDHVVIIVNVRCRRDGKSLAWGGANVWHVRDGKMAEVWALSNDQASTDAALA